MSFGRVLGAASFLALAAGCKDDGPFVGEVSRSRFFEYHDHVAEPLCPTLLPLLDRHALSVGSEVGLALSESDRLRYYRFSDARDLELHGSGCAPEAEGCVVEDLVYSTQYFHAHELAHQDVARAWGHSAVGLLLEGEAVTLSCDPLYALGPTERAVDVLGALDWRDLLYVRSDTRTGYAAAGFFVTALVERYGWPKLAELHARAAPGITAADFAREFAKTFPASLDDAWGSALGTPGAAPCLPRWQCETTPLAEGESATPDCDGETHRSVRIEDGPGAVVTVAGAGASAALMSCTGALRRGTLEGGAVTSRATHWAVLARGEYSISVPTTGRFELVDYPARAWFDASCDGAAPVLLAPDADTFFDVPAGPLDGTTGGVRYLRVSGGTTAFRVSFHDLVSLNPDDANAFALCDGCADDAECQALSPHDATSVVLGDNSVLRMTQAVALPPAGSPWGQIIFRPAVATGSEP